MDAGDDVAQMIFGFFREQLFDRPWRFASGQAMHGLGWLGTRGMSALAKSIKASLFTASVADELADEVEAGNATEQPDGRLKATFDVSDNLVRGRNPSQGDYEDAERKVGAALRAAGVDDADFEVAAGGTATVLFWPADESKVVSAMRSLAEEQRAAAEERARKVDMTVEEALSYAEGQSASKERSQAAFAAADRETGAGAVPSLAQLAREAAGDDNVRGFAEAFKGNVDRALEGAAEARDRIEFEVPADLTPADAAESIRALAPDGSPAFAAALGNVRFERRDGRTVATAVCGDARELSDGLARALEAESASQAAGRLNRELILEIGAGDLGAQPPEGGWPVALQGLLGTYDEAERKVFERAAMADAAEEGAVRVERELRGEGLDVSVKVGDDCSVVVSAGDGSALGELVEMAGRMQEGDAAPRAKRSSSGRETVASRVERSTSGNPRLPKGEAAKMAAAVHESADLLARAMAPGKGGE